MRRSTGAAAVLLAAFAALAWTAQRHSSVTVDEFAHLPAGHHYWRTGDFRLYGENPPLVKLLEALPLLRMRPQYEPDLARIPDRGWQPWLYGNDFMFRNLARYRALFSAGRGVTILLGAALGLAVFLVSRRRHGPTGGVLSLAVLALCPNVLAHAGLATVDVGASLFIFLAAASLLSYLERPGWGRAALAGLALGCAQLAKFSALAILPLYLAAPLLAPWPLGGGRPTLRALPARALQAATMLGVWVLVAAACYGGRGLFVPLGAHTLRSAALARAQRLLPAVPSPLPRQYLEGLDAQMTDVALGEFPNYLRGKWYRGGDPAYYLVALAVKVPAATLALLAAALASGAFRRTRFEPWELLLIALMAWLLLLVSLFNSLQIGIRYLLPLFPLAALLVGRLGRTRGGGGRARRAGAGLAVGWLAVSTSLAHPHFLSYFNEPAGGPGNGHRILLDSNLDWGQDLPALADFMRRNRVDRVELAYFGHVLPQLYGVDARPPGAGPRPAYTAISAQLLFGAGVFSYPMLYLQPPVVADPAWLASYRGKRPVARAGRSIWIFANS